MMQKLALVFYCLIILLLVGCDGAKGITTPIPIPTSSVEEILAELKLPGAKNINIYECSAQYPNIFPSGQVVAWIMTRREKLKQLDTYVRWNCEIKAFEIMTEENQKSRCGCP